MGRGLKILLIEDSETDAELILHELGRSGVECVGCTVKTRAEMIRQLTSFEPDIILADYSLPQFDGVSALAVARMRNPATPFIFVSGTIGEEKAIETLEQGATDYILKTNLQRLAPAVRRAIRDAKEQDTRKRLESQLNYLAQYDALTALPNRSL
ncbi:MAG TPA: response regulator, partial [Burkholderiales bacterium]|nr:response regulator [Burkholderiales bacterium]